MSPAGCSGAGCPFRSGGGPSVGVCRCFDARAFQDPAQRRETAEAVRALVAERDETLRRVRVALGALGVADCDDPIEALEALAEDTHRQALEAIDEHNAAVLRAHAEGRAAGLREALEIVQSYQRPSASPEPTELDYIASAIGTAR